MSEQIYIMRTPDGIDFPLPSYSSRYHFGLNLMAGIPSSLKIEPGERVRIPVGFAIGLPDQIVGQIISDKKLSDESGIVVLNAPAILNPADREPLFVCLLNAGNQQYVLRRGTVIAQLILFSTVLQVNWAEVKEDSFGKPSETKDFYFQDSGEMILSETPKRVRQSIRERSENSYEDDEEQDNV